MCRPTAELGFFGSSFFIGVISAVGLVPKFADSMGRYPFILMALLVQLVAQVGVIMTSSIYVAFFMEFLLGATFPGKSIVLYNYTMEACIPHWRQTFVNLNSIFDTGVIMFISVYYQHFSKSWIYLQLIGISATLLCLLFTTLTLEESPKFLYTKGRFEEAREKLVKIAKFNGSSKMDEIEAISFDTERIEVALNE